MKVVLKRSNSAPALVVTDEDEFDVNRIPSKALCNAASGRVHGLFRYNDSTLSLSLQDQDNHPTILIAKRGPWLSKVKFVILDAHHGHNIGCVSHVHSSSSCHVYSISSGKEPTIRAYILYQVPSITTVLQQSPPRRAQVAIASSPSAEFERVCMKAVHTMARLPDETTSALVGGVNMHVLTSKEPYTKANGRKGLDFGGRGALSSSKNMQLVRNNNIWIQMVKTGEGFYHLDYRNVTHLQAFGFALAQMDL